MTKFRPGLPASGIASDWLYLLNKVYVHDKFYDCHDYGAYIFRTTLVQEQSMSLMQFMSSRIICVQAWIWSTTYCKKNEYSFI